MKPSSLPFLILFTLVCSPLLLGQGREAQPVRQGIAEGLWEGSLSLRQSTKASGAAGPAQGSLSSGLKLRILAKGMGALMDIPDQSMYGYPLDEVTWTETRIRFSFDALGPGEELRFDGFLSSSASTTTSGTTKPSGGAIIGTATGASWKGSFQLTRAEAAPVPGETRLLVPTDEGSLPGTLLLPLSAQAFPPLVLLLAGAGTTDRNGNNYSVPGRSDSLAMLAGALASRGLASFRFDKRGSGEAYMLENQGMKTSLSRHRADAAAVLRFLSDMNRFSRITVMGMNEGAWTGAAAINILEGEGRMIDGFVAVDASGEEPLNELNASLESLDEAMRAEADAIIRAIKADQSYETPSAALADFFAPSRREWLKAWLGYDPSREVAGIQAPVLFIYGASDLQVQRKDFEKLLDARPAAAARLIPLMNYVLKQVKTEEENYDSFTNPDYPLAPGLVDLLAAFAKAKPLPSGSHPYERLNEN